jgi:RNA polymerase sigma-70 factor (ECF subfamily)
LHEREFVDLLQREEGKLLRIAWAMLGQESDAWDVLQGAIEQAWRHRRQLQGGPAAFPGWIRRIVVNRAIDQLRSRKRLILLDPAALPEGEPTLPVPEADLEARALWEELKVLEPGQRQVLVLRYLADLSLQEIADEVGIPLGTVKSRLYRALAHLRKTWDRRRAAP